MNKLMSILKIFLFKKIHEIPTFIFCDIYIFNYIWNWKVSFNFTALIIASKLGFLEIVQELLSQKGIDINIKDICKCKYS